MRHEKLDGIKTPFEKILSAVSSVHDVAASSLTTPTGSVSFDNSDGTRTIIGAQIGNNNIATHVGDTTPPPKPIFSAKCKGGVLSVQWDGKLEGEIPPDFYCVTFCTDTRVLGTLKSPGTVTTTIGDAKNNEYITVYGYSEDDACGADGSAKHNKSEKVSVKVQVVDDFEKIKDDITAFKKNADIKYAHKVDTDETTKKLTEQYEAVYTNNQKLNEKYKDVLTLKEQADELSEKLESNYYTTDKIDTMMNEQSNKSDSRISTIREQLTDTIHNITNEKESEIKQYVDRIITKIQDKDNALNVYEDSSKMVIYGNSVDALVLYNNGQLALCTIQIFDNKPVITSTKVSLGSDGLMIYNNDDDDFIIKNTTVKNFYNINFNRVEVTNKKCNTMLSKQLAIRGSDNMSVGSTKNITLALDPFNDRIDHCFFKLEREPRMEVTENYTPENKYEPCGSIDMMCSQYDNSNPNEDNIGSWYHMGPNEIVMMGKKIIINGQLIPRRDTIYLSGGYGSKREILLYVSMGIAELYIDWDCQAGTWVYTEKPIPFEYLPIHTIYGTGKIYKGSYPVDIWIPGWDKAEYKAGTPSIYSSNITGEVTAHITWTIGGEPH